MHSACLPGHDARITALSGERDTQAEHRVGDHTAEERIQSQDFNNLLQLMKMKTLFRLD